MSGLSGDVERGLFAPPSAPAIMNIWRPYSQASDGDVGESRFAVKWGIFPGEASEERCVDGRGAILSVTSRWIVKK